MNKIFQHEATSGILLFAALLLAMLFCNTGLLDAYEYFWHQPLSISLASYRFSQPLLFWVNDGLMTLFFFVIGLELKREFLSEKGNFSHFILPGVAALGGMVVPILIYTAINFPHPIQMQGWAIPVATDIALALGVLSLFGKKVPLTLRLFLLTLAIFDDVGAIIIIAIFNTDTLSYLSMFLALICLLGLAGLRLLNVKRASPYLFIGLLLWICVLESGVHATLTGILLSLTIPDTKTSDGSSVLRRMENFFKPWVNFVVLPIFAFANAGFAFYGDAQILFSEVVLGIAAGLFLGKPIGVMGVVLLFKQFKWIKFPEHTNWLAFFGVAILCGIGFTMSLFLGTLAFADNQAKYILEARVGVLLGSTLSAVSAAIILGIALSKKDSGSRG